ncbi:MAG: histidine--tRNA ligase family protein [Dehalococcoidia bacterium]|nr:histidine--tRNA ligase family protein [Dehalococcoidia bacterium]
MKNQRCKGMRDLLPRDMAGFRHVEDTFRACCLKCGYQEVRTPTLEYLHLFTAVGTLTPSMLSKVYSFLDWDGWSGERVVLRPDNTIPVARLYIDNLSEYERARLFYVSNSFIFEETGKKDRERWQCGAESIGGTKLPADAEIISLAREVLHRLGLDTVTLQLSHAGLVKALIKELKLRPSEEAKVTSRILEGDWQALTEVKSARNELDRFLGPLLNLKGKSGGFLQNVKALSREASSSFKSSLDDFIETTTLLDGLKCSYEIDITAIRTFEYYTGICFRFMLNGEKLGGGGRYDNLMSLMSGNDTTACGFALYVDPLLKLLRWENEAKPGILIRGKQTTPEAVEACFGLAQALRNAEQTVLVDFGEREPCDYRWAISISQEDLPGFTVTDCREKREWNAASPGEVLSIVRG